MYSFPNLKPVCYSMFGYNYCFLTCKQVSQEAAEVVWYSHLSKNFQQFVVIHVVKGFSIVNEAEIDVFLEFLDFSMIQCMLAICSLVPLPFLNPAWTWGSSVEASSTSGSCTAEAWLGEFWAWLYSRVRWVQLCGSLSILWHCLSSGLKWKLTFSSPVASADFSKFAGILSAALSQHHLSGFEIAHKPRAYTNQEVCN